MPCRFELPHAVILRVACYGPQHWLHFFSHHTRTHTSKSGSVSAQVFPPRPSQHGPRFPCAPSLRVIHARLNAWSWLQQSELEQHQLGVRCVSDFSAFCWNNCYVYGPRLIQYFRLFCPHNWRPTSVNTFGYHPTSLAIGQHFRQWISTSGHSLTSFRQSFRRRPKHVFSAAVINTPYYIICIDFSLLYYLYIKMGESERANITSINHTSDKAGGLYLLHPRGALDLV